MVDDPVWFELLSVDRLTVDEAVDTVGAKILTQTAF